MSIRPATHAGSWYTANKASLTSQLDELFAKAAKRIELSSQNGVPGARVLVGPHAGYSYAGTQLAETYASWDTTNCKRVFVIGPSHHVYFASTAKVSKYDFYATPLGNLPVDTQVCSDLTSTLTFSYMSPDEDQDEHSFEMHAPFIYHKAHESDVACPKIVPIMISAMSEQLYSDIVGSLKPYFLDSSNTFAVSSDFCHWGSRFGYTKYLQKLPALGKTIDIDDMINIRSRSQLVPHVPIHRSIEALDKEAMRIASVGSYEDWNKYISETQNTICGQKPIAVVLRLLQNVENSGFTWIGYSQSGEVSSPNESSVSYASGYVTLR